MFNRIQSTIQMCRSNVFLKENFAKAEKTETSKWKVGNPQQPPSTLKKKQAELQVFLKNWGGEVDALESGPIRGPMAQGIDEEGPITMESFLGGTP